MTLDIQHDLLLFLQVFIRIFLALIQLIDMELVILSWEKQPTPINIQNGYQLKTPSTKTKIKERLLKISFFQF